MATRDHALDQRIIDAAKAEFMAHGFQSASLHKIVERAGITTGALYTRYKNKDDLFCSLVRPALEDIAQDLAPMEALYLEARRARSADALVQAIQQEEQVYLDLLYQHYDECVLLFCKSAGSSLETRMDRMMEEKTRQTVAFFRTMARRDIDFDGITLLMSQQFAYYRQMLLRGYSKEKAVSCMQTMDIYIEAGWKAIFGRLL